MADTMETPASKKPTCLCSSSETRGELFPSGRLEGKQNCQDQGFPWAALRRSQICQGMED